ncbi:MAG: hypothetical protein JWQ97_3310 [Phenylobacterium sp.]|nr:hypothetical protein [Phenylobacterium sp.]
MVVRPPYRQMSQPLGAAAVWRYLLDEPATPREVAEFPYLADWRKRFDYVLVVGPEPAQDNTPGGLVLIRAGEAASLYRIDHRGREDRQPR